MKKIKAFALNTEFPRWKAAASTSLLTLMCLGVAGSFWYLYLSEAQLRCYEGFLYLSLVWVAVELVLLFYLFQFTSIPRFVRDAIGLIIALSNVWFGLFIFGLTACEI
ncbi:hypothetical protein [Aestuariirhabdus haliotis]|uniref:hypothetical protein n=1 Tax=Aestuariirhabdus haliotis TaxID=2918751 RepID=UPI00201B396A|nr:hypothetical protein [Aestuariirhabdus haliotis]MCL6421505.1 hypothetical protein [Aestuariirhabdus haliotis]